MFLLYEKPFEDFVLEKTLCMLCKWLSDWSTRGTCVIWGVDLVLNYVWDHCVLPYLCDAAHALTNLGFTTAFSSYITRRWMRILSLKLNRLFIFLVCHRWCCLCETVLAPSARKVPSHRKTAKFIYLCHTELLKRPGGPCEAVNPCLRGGTCIARSQSSYDCICHVRYTGPHCEGKRYWEFVMQRVNYTQRLHVVVWQGKGKQLLCRKMY